MLPEIGSARPAKKPRAGIACIGNHGGMQCASRFRLCRIYGGFRELFARPGPEGGCGRAPVSVGTVETRGRRDDLMGRSLFCSQQLTSASFRYKKFSDTVIFLFLFDKHYPICSYRDLQCIISFCFYLYLILYIYTARFDVTKNLKKFLDFT